MFYWPNDTGKITIVIPRSVAAALRSEARRAEEEMRERAAVLVGEESGDTFIVNRIYSSDLLELHGVVRFRAGEQELFGPNAGAVTLYTIFNPAELANFLKTRINGGERIILAHSHHSHFSTPAVQDFGTSASFGVVSLCYALSKQDPTQMVFHAFRGGNIIPVTSL